MKPAWHEVVASLETSHVVRGGNGALPPAPRPLPVRWQEVASVTAPRPRPSSAAPTRADLVAEVERRMGMRIEGLAVVLVDIDAFKTVNQDQGYGVGDRVLELTGARLSGAAAGGGMAARFGSDEFAVVLEGVEPARALATADRLLTAISEPMSIGGVSLRIGASAGIALRSDTHARPEELVRDAERALARARTLGGGRAVAHDPAVSGRPLALAELEAALRRALDTDEFREHFQPIVSVKGGQVAGFEVHLWRRSGANGKRR